MEPSLEQYNEKESKLNELRSRLERTVDGLGMRIDSGIFETNLYLNALDIKTRQSCEGHIDHGLPYPWVDITVASESTDEYKQYQKECRDFGDTPDIENNKRVKEFYDVQFQKYKDILEKVKHEKEETRKQIEDMLLEFQKENPETLKYRLSKRLRLLPLDVPELYAYEWGKKLSSDEREEMLNKSQDSMKRFTEYLKGIYTKV